MIGACPQKDRTMDDERSIKWAGIWARVPATEENWSFRRQIGQKPEANVVGVEVSMSEGTPDTQSVLAYGMRLTQDKGSAPWISSP